MIKLKKATIHKYKCIESDQTFEVDGDITVLVGMNESGKTSILEALAKTNYFDPKDSSFKYKATHDYPRKEKKQMDKSQIVPRAVTCEFEISEDLLSKIQNDLGNGVFTQKTFTRSINYENKPVYCDIQINREKFISNQISKISSPGKTLEEKLASAENKQDMDSIIEGYKDEAIKTALLDTKKYYNNEWGWDKQAVNEYVARVYLNPHLPKFLYYDEYYTLPSRISIEDLQTKKLKTEDLKTAKALFDLADINIDDLIQSDEFEDFKAELEATEATITDELFKYWSTNKNLDIEFEIDKKEKTDEEENTTIVEHILDIRVRNNRTKVSLPLRNRSKGFNWFFSFLVWFKKIQEDVSSNYVLLLDEPGLNLHASAQADLLKFIEHLTGDYQILYTTHSPFMVDPACLNRVRTVVDSDKGAIISDSVQEKDPNTLFPLQAALGYDIAQNLYISKNNLLVEGVSDLIYFQAISSLLEEQKRTSLRDDITIVPVGGLEKVSSFVSLLRGSNLNIACMLDSTIDIGSKTKLDNLVKQKIIHKQKILSYDEFVDGYARADVEDLFDKDDYLKLFNAAFNEHLDIKESDLDSKFEKIIDQINKHLEVDRFNHYRPAMQLARISPDHSYFSKETLNRFEKMFEKINSLFSRVALKA